MRVAWESLEWTKISAMASCVSVALSAITLGVAIYAMGAWKSQEKVKAKREIKKAAGKLYVEVGLMPEKFINMNVTNGQAVSKSPNFEVLVSQKNQGFIDEWLKHEKLSELYLQLKYLGYAVVDDLTSAQKEALNGLDATFNNYYSYNDSKINFEQSLKDFLDKMDIYK
ncbi:hypothetical protein [Rahnella victoriana]|uniref:Uncharacterized protein n=1 Tax=Rahnella victoriana TaxID=1510570 RepID=A0ABS0DTS7_9GAMM|nr:hypothetical protein [Rahnella victoriana]MBF7955523.1 hypothetical protein [Rahnella victoriana]